MAASLHVAGLAVTAIEMDNDLVVERRFHRAGDGAFIGGTTIGGDTIYVYGLIGHAARNPAVNHIHHAANRRRTIEQGGGATQDRSEERRVGKEWVSTVRSRWSPVP